MSEKKHFYGLFPEEVAAICVEKGLPKFVGSQLYNWVYKKNVLSLADMKNISKKNQALLDEVFDFTLFKSSHKVQSKEENAIKVVGQLEDNNYIECVILKEKDYTTLCVSSQCGCPVDCKFCLTGVVGFKRQLTAAEIVAQVIYSHSVGHPVKNIVFMGMGEPLLNYDNVFKALDILTHKDGLDMSKRHITISTSGYMAGLERLVKDERYVNLAFSVGSADPMTRERLMPIEKRQSIIDFSRKLKEYQGLHNRKVTLEYTLLEGVNDSEYDIKCLMNLATYLDAKINLINLNPHKKIPFRPISINALHRIKAVIQKRQLPVTIRYKKGQDITAACGQLGESYLEGV